MRSEASLLKELAVPRMTAARKAHLENQLEATAPGALAELNQAKVDEVLAELAGQEGEE